MRTYFVYHIFRSSYKCYFSRSTVIWATRRLGERRLGERRLGEKLGLFGDNIIY